MWSSVERTALAEAEVEYHEKTSPTVWVKFPITRTLDRDLDGASVLIWTTTPWTIPANRAIAFGSEIAYGLYRVTDAPPTTGPRSGPLRHRRQAGAGHLRGRACRSAMTATRTSCRS